VALSDGVASIPVSGLSYGTHGIVAYYFPTDAAQFTYSNNALPGKATFQSDTTTTLNVPATVEYNQPVTLTATVAAKPGAATPAGAVAFYVDGQWLGTKVLSAGSASLVVTPTIGAHTITAVYQGSALAAGSSTSQALEVQGAATTTSAVSVTSDGNPVTTASCGQPLTLTATVTSASGTPFGSVAFMRGSALIGYGTLIGGVATLVTSSLPAGSDAITATYLGAYLYQSSASATATTVNVSAASTSVALTPSTTATVYGQPITFSVKVTNNGTGGVPTGYVNLYDGETLLAVRYLAADGTASFSTSTLGAASHAIRAVYQGTSSFPSGSASAVVNISPVQTELSLSSSTGGVSSYHQAVTFTATVSNLSGTGALPGGTVLFYADDSDTPLIAAYLSPTKGSATLTWAGLSVGTHTIRAVFVDGDNFATSEATMTQTVS
jgi:hypothetical protein